MRRRRRPRPRRRSRVAGADGPHAQADRAVGEVHDVAGLHRVEQLGAPDDIRAAFRGRRRRRRSTWSPGLSSAMSSTSGPIRSFGPGRSWRIATGRPARPAASRTRWAVSACCSAVPCEKFSRATSMPARPSGRASRGPARRGRSWRRSSCGDQDDHGTHVAVAGVPHVKLAYVTAGDRRQGDPRRASARSRAGHVTTYGDVCPGAPRRAGAALSAYEDPSVPWQRVVRADGSLAKGERQRALLEAERVPFRGARVDMRAAWVPRRRGEAGSRERRAPHRATASRRHGGQALDVVEILGRADGEVAPRWRASRRAGDAASAGRRAAAPGARRCLAIRFGRRDPPRSCRGWATGSR